MDNATIDTAPRPQPRGRPVNQVPLHYALSVAAGLVLLVCLAGLVVRHETPRILPAALIYCAGSLLIWNSLKTTYPHSRLGMCNVTTQMRVAISAALMVPLTTPSGLEQGIGWAVLIVAVLNLALDGLDGRLARNSGLVSGFGARFDMEVDAVFALVLAVLVLQKGDVGWTVLVLGLPRYGFLLAGLIWPWLCAPLPERLRRKAVCVIQITTLIILLVPGLPPNLSHGLTLVAGTLLFWSFATDILCLARRRP